MDPAELAAVNMDAYTDHFYPPKPEMVTASAAAAEKAGKVYYVGEYAWDGSDGGPSLASFLATIEATEHCVGSLYWSLFPHADDSGTSRAGNIP